MILDDISLQLQQGHGAKVRELVLQALGQGYTAQEILGQGLVAGMNVIGEKYKSNELFVPQVLVAARAMNVGVHILQPHLCSDGTRSVGRVCLGTIQGDLHDIGKNIVKLMMQSKGLEVIDLGSNVTPEDFARAAKEHGCQVIGCSALLTSTMDAMADVVRAVEEAGIRDQVKIMIGGAPVTEQFCRHIHADAYTDDAVRAAELAVAFCK